MRFIALERLKQHLTGRQSIAMCSIVARRWYIERSLTSGDALVSQKLAIEWIEPGSMLT